MKAMILCAGLGTRLRPITETIPKPLLPFFGKPVVVHTLDRFVEAGIEGFVINLHHLPEKIMSALGTAYRGVPIEYSREPEILGPVGGIRKALPLLGDEAFVVVNGDIVIDIDYTGMLEQHKKTGAALTLAAGPGYERPELRALGVDGRGRVRQVWGEPEWSGAALEKKVNLGAFVYEPRIARDFIPDGAFYDFRTQMIPALFEAGERICVYETGTYWNDIGTPESYLKAHMDIFNGKSAACSVKITDDLSVDSELSGRNYLEKNVVVEPGASVGPCVAAYGGATVGKGAAVKNSVILPGAVIRERTTVENTVVF
ncbi:MAG TPA: NDP-sugar synthase [bacterium]|nr:NDP-sugar synthase [bacterium]